MASPSASRSRRIWAVLAAVVGLMIGAGLLDERSRSPLGFIVFGVFAVVFLVIAVVNAATTTSLQVTQDGFTLRRPFRPARSVGWDEVRYVRTSSTQRFGARLEVGTRSGSIGMSPPWEGISADPLMELARWASISGADVYGIDVDADTTSRAPTQLRDLGNGAIRALFPHTLLVSATVMGTLALLVIAAAWAEGSPGGGLVLAAPLAILPIALVIRYATPLLVLDDVGIRRGGTRIAYADVASVTSARERGGTDRIVVTAGSGARIALVAVAFPMRSAELRTLLQVRGAQPPRPPGS